MSETKFSRRALLAGGAALALTNLQAATRKPNILWLVSEDNNPFIGAYGDRLAHTPTIDALAAAGIRYANAFSNAPVCAPSRFGIITGMYPQSCGPAHHMRAVGRIPAYLQGFPHYLRQAGYYCTNNVKTDYNAPIDPQSLWDESSSKAHWNNRPSGAPFFAVFNSMTTHESQVFKTVAGRVRPDQVRVPAYLPDVPEVRNDIASYYNLMERMDGELSSRLAELEAAGLADDTIVFYYSDNGGVLPRSKRFCYDQGLRTALIVRMPKTWSHLATHAAGSVVEAPVSFIDLAPTVLALAGVQQPAHLQGKAFLGPGAAVSKYSFGMRNRMDERYDMVRTVRDHRYRYIRNYSPHRIGAQHVAFAWQMPAWQAWEAGHRDRKLDTKQEAFWREKPAEEFYDLQADPDQTVNLIDAVAHRPTIEAMRLALDAHMVEVNDNGFIPEGSALEGYDASRAAGAYPLQRVMEIAGQAILRDARNESAFVQSLRDSNEVIRYWAAQGLLMLQRHSTSLTTRDGRADDGHAESEDLTGRAHDRAAPPSRTAIEGRRYSALAKCMAEDASTSVRIVAAEALATLGDASNPVRFLGETLDSHPNVRVRLQALNALTFIGPAAQAVLPAIERAATHKDEYLGNAGRYLALALKGTYTPQSKVFEWPAR